MSSSLIFSSPGFCDICERTVEFRAKYDWFRDHLLCSRCGSVPRERALMQVIKRYYPKYRKMRIHESSPGDRGVSPRLQRECRKYSFSHFFPDVSPGETHPKLKMRCENLESLTFPDSSFDLFITQDVAEHIMDPAAAFREIARVLRPGGAHIFTVPLVRKGEATRRRAELAGDGKIVHLLEPEFHGSPTDENGSLVTMDWGYDIVKFIAEVAGMPGHIVHIDDLYHGIRAEFIEVVVSLKR